MVSSNSEVTRKIACPFPQDNATNYGERTRNIWKATPAAATARIARKGQSHVRHRSQTQTRTRFLFVFFFFVFPHASATWLRDQTLSASCATPDRIPSSTLRTTLSPIPLFLRNPKGYRRKNGVKGTATQTTLERGYREKEGENLLRGRRTSN